MGDFNNLGVRWYVVHTYSGYENKVKANLEKIIENRHLEHLIYDIFIPMETVVEKTGDDEKAVESKLFPAYVLVKMIMTDESWHVVRNITGVTGFVGPGSAPVPLTDEEVKAFIQEERVEETFTFKIGDTVAITSDPFAQLGYTGTLTEISEDGQDVTVAVNMPGRAMPVKLSIRDIKKIED